MNSRLGGIYEQVARASAEPGEALDGVQRLIVQSVMLGLRITRAGIWVLRDENNGLQCLRLLDQGRDLTEQTPVLKRADFPAYFAELDKGGRIAADDAETHPATAEFRDVYLRPLSITSMLDVPLQRGGACLGVICCEHQRARRTWLPEEMDFAGSMATLYISALDARE